MISYIIATPLTFSGALKYMKLRNSAGIKGLMIASWVIYGIEILNGDSMIAMGASDEDVPTGWIVFYLFRSIFGWVLMFIHAEKARKSPPKSTQ